MNVDTGEVRAIEDITDEERATGKWVLLPRAAAPRTAGTQQDRNRKKRERRAKRSSRAKERRAR